MKDKQPVTKKNVFKNDKDILKLKFTDQWLKTLKLSNYAASYKIK